MTPASLSARRFDWILGFTLSLLALALFLFRLEHPAEPYFDETLHVFAANDWLHGRVMSDFAHPPLSRWFIALSLWLGPGGFDVAKEAWTSHHVWWWRIPSVLAGTATVGAVYALGRSLRFPPSLAALAATLLMLDGVFYVHARIGMTNAFSILFIVLATGGCWRAIRDDEPRWLLAGGLALGAAIGTRWTGVFALLSLLIAVLALRRPWALSSPQQVDRWLLHGILGFAALPAACYVAVFLPLQLNLAPAGSAAGALNPGFWETFLGMNRQLLSFHEYGIVHHPGHSAWWTWPSMVNPLWYYLWLDHKQMQLRCIMTIGNPVLWWLATPVWGYGAIQSFRTKNAALGLVVWMGAALWLAWAVTARSTTFMTYFGESLPFAALALAGVMATLQPKWRNGLLPVCTTLATLWFVWTAPLISASTLRVEDYEARLLYAQWDMIRQAAQFREDHGLQSPARFKAYTEKLGNQTWRYQPGESHSTKSSNAPDPPKK